MRSLSMKINWVSIVMLLSLGVNFFVVGFLFAEHKAKEIKMTRLSFDNSISKIVEPFPRQGKHDFYVTMRSKRSQLIPIYRSIMDQRAAIMNIIAEEQFDSIKLTNAMQQYHDSYHSMVGSSQEVIVKVIGGLDVTERQAILERFNNLPKRDYRSRDNNRRRSSSDKKSQAENDHDWW